MRTKTEQTIETVKTSYLSAQRSAGGVNSRNNMKTTQILSLSILFILGAPAPASAQQEAAPSAATRILMIGDSTMATFKSPPPDRPELTGWGQVFGQRFNDQVTVINRAISGRSAKSFITGGNWERALQVKADYLFIQFGHNDSHLGEEKSTDAKTDYRDYLRRYIDESRAAGMVPVLVTPMTRRLFRKGVIATTLRPYADAMIAVGEEKSVPVIDLHANSVKLHNQLGEQGSRYFNPSANDRTHFTRRGAEEIARLVASDIPQQVPTLKSLLKGDVAKGKRVDVARRDQKEPAGVPPLDPPYVVKDVPGVVKNRLLPPTPGNARNSEGDFIQLNDGRVMFVYSHFTGGGSDHAAGHLAGRFSSDGGLTWTKEDIVVLPQSGGFNDMSVSLLRLQNGNIALFHIRKNSMLDCRPVLRISVDEGKTWGDPIECIRDQVGYYVLNNDRVIQLRDGRLILAVSLHNLKSYEKPNWNGHVMCYISDDSGATWRRNQTVLAPVDANGTRLIAQEPGLVELKDGRLMMFIRSNAGSQLICYSMDRGETWSTPKPSSIISPVSPATIERIPSTGDLLIAWNDHSQIDKRLKGKRTPFNVAISRDEGISWTGVRTLEDDPNGWYCYTAMDFIDGRVVLGHCAGDRRKGGLSLTQITHFPIEWLYRDGTPENQASKNGS